MARSCTAHSYSRTRALCAILDESSDYKSTLAAALLTLGMIEPGPRERGLRCADRSAIVHPQLLLDGLRCSQIPRYERKGTRGISLGWHHRGRIEIPIVSIIRGGSIPSHRLHGTGDRYLPLAIRTFFGCCTRSRCLEFTSVTQPLRHRDNSSYVFFAGIGGNDSLGVNRRAHLKVISGNTYNRFLLGALMGSVATDGQVATNDID